MTTTEMADALPLLQFIEPLQAHEDLHLSLGSDLAGHFPLAGLPRDAVVSWMADMSHNHKDMDDKTRAAYLIGAVAWGFALNLGAMHLANRGLPDIAPDAIAVAREWYRWEHEGETGDAVRFTIRLVGSPDALHQPLDIAGASALIAATHAPLIETLFEMTRLGRNAMWRLVADAIAAGWLNVGKQIGQEDRAMAAAEAIIRFPGSPMANKQTGFIEIVVRDEAEPERVLGCEWFRARGGCCRYYVTEESAGEYCTTCVLRPAESRDQRLHDYLKDKLLAPA